MNINNNNIDVNIQRVYNDELCNLCCDEDNNELYKIRCNVCKFECCSECYDKIESNTCPNCKDPHYKQHHEETVHTTELELFEDMIREIETVVIQQYETQLLILYSIIEKLENKVKKQSELLNNKRKKEKEVIECLCGKKIQKASYNKHCKSKYHSEFVSKHSNLNK